MRYRDAKKLHNGDEVIDKLTGEVVKVLTRTVKGKEDGLQRPTVFIAAMSPKDGWQEYIHTEVK